MPTDSDKPLVRMENVLHNTKWVTLKSSFHIQAVVPLTVVAAMAWFVGQPFLTLAFWGDDTFYMKLAANHNAFELVFAGPARTISTYNFMPLLGLHFYVDRLLFGIGFLGRNLHSLFWLAAVGYLTFLFFRQLGLKLWSALSGGVALMVAPAAVSVAGHYSNRHYLIGLAFALIALMMVVKWSRTNRTGCYWGALVFYFLALSCKEVYAPLLLIAGFIAYRLDSDVRKTAIGFVSALGIYLLLRWIVVGSVVGGYTHSLDWDLMAEYLLRSYPRMVQTLVWGGEVPGQISWPAVSLGSSLLAATMIFAFREYGLWGIAWFGGLLIASLCVVAMTLYVPQVRYLDDPFYCHGDRLALAFSAAVWFSFWYFAGRWLDEKMRSSKYLFVCALGIIVPLTIYGGLAKAHHWKKEKATIAQVSYLNDNASQNWLVIGHPTWFLRHYVTILNTHRSGVQLRSVDQPVLLKTLRSQTYTLGVEMHPDQPIAQSNDKDELRKWLRAYLTDYCRLLPDRCPKDLPQLLHTFSSTVSSRCEPIPNRDSTN